MTHLTEKLSRVDELVRDQINTDLEAVLRLPQGRRFLALILERCGVHRNAYTGERGSTDFRLGEQNVALWLISQIDEVSTIEYPALLMETAKLNEERRSAAVADDE